jgi:hypothetical protein
MSGCVVPRFLGFDQRRQDLHAIAFGGAGLGLPQGLDLGERRAMVGLGLIGRMSIISCPSEPERK